mmetsp:Transcript_78228/g.135686  ORF Transcript_78228/g.135686 Transcript_78228/m.135686 type:complete len:174 (+) Transcript_78228:86-607(+)
MSFLNLPLPPLLKAFISGNVFTWVAVLVVIIEFIFAACLACPCKFSMGKCCAKYCQLDQCAKVNRFHKFILAGVAIWNLSLFGFGIWRLIGNATAMYGKNVDDDEIDVGHCATEIGHELMVFWSFFGLFLLFLIAGLGRLWHDKMELEKKVKEFQLFEPKGTGSLKEPLTKKS